MSIVKSLYDLLLRKPSLREVRLAHPEAVQQVRDWIRRGHLRVIAATDRIEWVNADAFEPVAVPAKWRGWAELKPIVDFQSISRSYNESKTVSSWSFVRWDGRHPYGYSQDAMPLRDGFNSDRSSAAEASRANGANANTYGSKVVNGPDGQFRAVTMVNGGSTPTS